MQDPLTNAPRISISDKDLYWPGLIHRVAIYLEDGTIQPLNNRRVSSDMVAQKNRKIGNSGLRK